MDNLLHFAAEEKVCPGEPFLALGYGFTEEGLWQERPLPEAAALAVDDRFLPAPEGLDRALEVLKGWNGWIFFDFERPPAEPLIRLLEGLAGSTAVVPPAYEKHPHWGVLAGPYQPGQSFARWLRGQQARFGRVVLDAAPLRCRVRPGHSPEPWTGPLPSLPAGILTDGRREATSDAQDQPPVSHQPEAQADGKREAPAGVLAREIFLCPGADCLCCRNTDGSLLFLDTQTTLRRRCARAGVPAVILAEEWSALQKD